MSVFTPTQVHYEQDKRKKKKKKSDPGNCTISLPFVIRRNKMTEGAPRGDKEKRKEEEEEEKYKRRIGEPVTTSINNYLWCLLT